VRAAADAAAGGARRRHGSAADAPQQRVRELLLQLWELHLHGLLLPRLWLPSR